jgi:hypothetical protein
VNNVKKDDHGYAELVGLFHSCDDLENAISTITSSGWDRASLSLLTQHHLLESEHLDASMHALADDPESERRPPISDTDVRQGRTMLAGMAGVTAAFLASGATIMTGGGTLAAVVGAAVAGGGAGAMVEALGQKVGRARERFLREQLDHGGILLWVKIETPEGERKARKIFASCNASDIHLHTFDSAEGPKAIDRRS